MNSVKCWKCRVWWKDLDQGDKNLERSKTQNDATAEVYPLVG
jgi:hypothetical protein